MSCESGQHHGIISVSCERARARLDRLLVTKRGMTPNHCGGLQAPGSCKSRRRPIRAAILFTQQSFAERQILGSRNLRVFPLSGGNPPLCVRTASDRTLLFPDPSSVDPAWSGPRACSVPAERTSQGATGSPRFGQFSTV